MKWKFMIEKKTLLSKLLRKIHIIKQKKILCDLHISG